MASCDFIIRDYKTEDAQALVEFFNESEEGWPGGFTGGVEITPEYVRESIEKDDNIAVLLAFHGEKVVGFLKLTKHWVTNDASYVKLLNVHPKFRGRGIGTALLKEAISRTIKAGLNRIDLHTWSGNERAIRLYKKLGFKWVPGTNVYMQNYLPYIAKFPPFQEILRRNPEALYEFEKQLSFSEDGRDEDGRKVFIYEWKKYGFKLCADPLSWKVCGISWPEGRIILSTKDEAVRGVPYDIVLEIENRGSSERIVSIEGIAVPEKDVELTFPNKTLKVKGGEKKKLKAVFKIMSGVQEKIGRDEPSRHVAFSVKINGISAELGIGFKDTKPLTVEYIYPRFIPPKYDGKIIVSLRNKTKEGFTVKIKDPLDGREKEVNIEPHGGYTATLIPGPLVGRVFSTEIEYTVVKDKTAYSGYKAQIKIPIVTFDKIAWIIDKSRKEIFIYTWNYTARIRLRGGSLDIYKPSHERLVGNVSEAIGPPLWPNPLERLELDYKIEEHDGAVDVTLSSPQNIGEISYRKRLVFHIGVPGIEIYIELKNNSNQKLEKIIKVDGWMPHWYHDTITLPLRDKITTFKVIPGETAPSKYALPAEPKEFSETWSHNMFIDESTVAVLWSRENLEKLDFSWGRMPSLQYKLSLDPGEEKIIGPIIIVPQKLSIDDVRKIYTHLHGEIEPAEKQRTEEPLITTKPMPIMLERGETKTIELVIKTFRSKKTVGKLKIGPLNDLNLDTSEHDFTLTKEQRAAKATLTLTAPTRLGAWNIPLTAITSHRVFEKKIPVIVYRGGGEVKCVIREDKAVLDNGYLKLSIDTNYAGTVYSLIIDGKENLYTPYPETKLLEWLNPWYGGIRVRQSLGSDDKLWREKWSVKKVSLNDLTGIQVSTKVSSNENRELKGVEIAQQYLTWPQSNIIAIKTTIKNTTAWLIKPRLAYYIFTRPGGTPAQLLQVNTGNEKIVWKIHDQLYDEPYIISKQGFAAVKNTEKTAILVSGNKDTDIGVICLEKKHGCHLYLDYEPTKYLKPGETATILAYLVYTDNKTPIEPYHALKKLQL